MNESINEIIFWSIIIGFIIICYCLCLKIENQQKDSESLNYPINQSVNETQQESIKIYRLEETLTNLSEDTHLENGDCLYYSLFYKEFLNNKYPILDVRKIDKAGLCPIGTEECGESQGMKHTYLIVNGWGGECILDQHQLKCIQVVK